MSKDEQDKLVVDLKKGCEKAFERFVAVFKTKITGIAYNFLGDTEAAQDVAQNVFMKVFQKIYLFREEAQFSSWVYRITMNEIFMHYKKVKKHTHYELDEKRYPDPNNCPRDTLLKSELNKLLISSVQKLEEKEKVVFIFRDIEEMNTNEVCRTINVTIPTVKSRLFRGRRKLRQSMVGKYLLGIGINR